MQISNIPAKWYVPFATNDSSKVEIPVTTSDPTRASQSLGFPPLTMQPPESGGVPPQGEDFNGAMNQVARIVWWLMASGPFAYDSTFATNSNINGYPQGAAVPSADLQGVWLSTADNNQINPDTVGTNWVPGFAYGTLALSGQTGGTTTLTPAQAIKTSMTITGTLGSNLTVVVPTWIRNWTVTNSTTGGFTVTVKTAGGSGVTIPQDATPTRVSGDGTNIVQAPENIASPTQGTHALPFGQAGHGQCRLIFSSATAIKLMPFNGANVIVNGVPLTLPSTGVTATNSGLSASTFYYVYLGGTTASPSLAFSTTGYNTLPNGVNTLIGDNTKTLVGAVLTNGSTQFSVSNNFYGVISWFNRRNIGLQPVTASGATASLTPVEINSNNRVTFICWGEDSIISGASGYATNTSNGALVELSMGFNSTSVSSGQVCAANVPAANGACGLSSIFSPTVGTENQAQFITPLGFVSAGTGTFNIINSVTIRG